jgi:hypothetical protein
MIVAYNIGVDGWTPCKTDHPPVRRGYGPIEISDGAWDKLSKNGVIECDMHFTDTEHLIAVAAFLDRKA